MELIFADNYHRDIGVINDYNFDLAYGTSENDFEFSMPLSAHCCEEGYYLYIEGTEYGGIIDSIKVDTAKDTVTYMGRTWHGILANAILEPERGEDYLILSGDANEVIQQIIDRVDLGSLFYAKSTESNFEIVSHQFYRYVDAYNGMLMMLSDNSAKLKMSHIKDRIMLEAVELIDYSSNEEWDSTQMNVKLERAYHPCNHLVCLGSGNLANRHVIHLFTDENGGIQPYSVDSNPLEDSDYILDKSKQLIKGIDEVCKVLDYGNAQTAENYIPINTQPKKWAKKYMNYFVQEVGEDGSVRYVEAEATETEGYTKLATQPSDWAKRYMEYFIKRSDYYENVPAVVIPAENAYRQITKKPSDWAKKYGSYYFLYSDGVTTSYKSVQGVAKYTYKLQTRKPTDWDLGNYTAYFKPKSGGGYEQIAKASTPPKWKKSKYYTRITSYKAPDFDKQRKLGVKYYVYYVKKAESYKAPTFVANKYYKYSEDVIIPAWMEGTYYRKALDNYADLIEDGIKKLQSYWNADKIDINLESTGQDYDVGDIVGATDLTTNLNVIRAISKKIVTISSGNIQIKYKLGG